MMTRSRLVLTLALGGLAVTGCPSEDDSGCRIDGDCPESYVCDALIGICRPIEAFSCQTPADCSDATCSRAGYCRPDDCHVEGVGCVAGYVCASSNEAWVCVPESSPTAQGGGGSGGETSAAAGEASQGGSRPD